MAMAEKRPVLVITKKEFFAPAKNAVFWQILTIISERSFQRMNTGWS
jgi:hypothetical protein